MEVVIKISEYAPCYSEVFTINSKKAVTSDFGDTKAIGLGDYTCGFDGFVGKAPTDEVLEKYQITTKEYAEIVERLNTVLDYGVCNMCE